MAVNPRRNTSLNRFRNALFRWLHKKYVALLPATEYCGFHLYFEPEQIENVVAGIKLLEHLYPRGYKRALKFTSTIVVTEMPTHYDEAAEACYLNLLNADSVEIAASLVHESTHAYLVKIRRIPYCGILKEKHERICMSEQTRFMNLYFATGSKEDAKKCREAWKRHLDQTLSTPWWQDSVLQRMSRFIRDQKKQK